jgi:hypothetical protein
MLDNIAARRTKTSYSVLKMNVLHTTRIGLAKLTPPKGITTLIVNNNPLGPVVAITELRKTAWQVRRTRTIIFRKVGSPLQWQS